RAAALITFATLSLAGSMPAGTARADGDGTWSSLDSTAASPGNRREYAAIYDVANQRYLIFGGFYGTENYSVYMLFNDVWTLSLGATPTWGSLNLSGPVPGPRHSPQWAYDPARSRLLMVGGCGSHCPGAPYADRNG